jgi:hypothetical protein
VSHEPMAFTVEAFWFDESWRKVAEFATLEHAIAYCRTILPKYPQVRVRETRTKYQWFRAWAQERCIE